MKDKEKPASYKSRPSPTIPSKHDSQSSKILIFIVLVGIPVVIVLWLIGSSNSPSNNNDWRSNIDPNNLLSDNQTHTVRASLKPILDKSSRPEQEQGVSTLLILSSDEENAAKLARCLLVRVNTQTHKDKVILSNTTILKLKLIIIYFRYL